jgi:hypothetical protein
MKLRKTKAETRKFILPYGMIFTNIFLSTRLILRRRKLPTLAIPLTSKCSSYEKGNC